MRRRDIIFVAGGAAALIPLAVRAQPKTMAIVGVLSAEGTQGPNFSLPPYPLSDGPIRQGLRETGFFEGKNVAFEYRWAEGHYDRLPALAAELVNRNVDLIIARSGAPGALAAKNATSTIPIIFPAVGDPVGLGIVASLARPGGNITGFTINTAGMVQKLVDLLSELVPGAGGFAYLVNPANQAVEHLTQDAVEAARAKGLRLSIHKASTVGEIDAVFASLVELRVGALVVVNDSFFARQRNQFIALASRHGIPTAYPWFDFAAAGGLIGFGYDDPELARQAGVYAGRILKGARPADLPVQQPTIFRLAINLRTAKALGLTVPVSILVRADEVIE